MSCTLALLERLWRLTGVRFDADAPEWNPFFDPVGLILMGQPTNRGYWCTPPNSLTIAGTGGDGCHFGLLDIGDGFTDDSPVVMTVPMNDNPNVVVGANLSDFLALGCRLGFFGLDQLSFSPSDAILELDTRTYPSDLSHADRALLKLIEDSFQVKPWLNHSLRLDELRDLYGQWVPTPEPPELSAEAAAKIQKLIDELPMK